MIVEINFIEQKKKNMVPYLLLLLFLLLFAAASYLLYWQITDQQQQLDSVRAQLDINSEKQTEISEIISLQEKRLALAEQVEHLETSSFPSVALLNEMDELLPADSFFTNYSFTSRDGLQLDVYIPTMAIVATYIDRLEQQSYISNVNLSNVSVSYVDDTPLYLATIQLDVNDQKWMEVVYQ